VAEARYTLAPKSNSTCRLCRKSKKSTVSLWPRTHWQHRHWRQSRKDVRHSGDKNYPLSTELKMFNFGDNVDRDRVDKVERAAATVDFRQTSDRLAIKSKVSATNRRQSRQSTLSPICRRCRQQCRLCRQCVPDLSCVVHW